MEEYKSQDKIKNKKQKNMIVLPYLNNENKNNLIEPNSILAKFIRNKKNEFVKFAENELKRPIKLYINRNKGNKGNIKFLSKDKLNNKNIFITDNNISVITSSNKEKENDSEKNDNNSNLENNQNRINTISYEYKKPKIKNNYSRLRTYQPIISENWKYRNGLRLSLGTDKINSSPVQNDIEYQYKIINDEYKLLEDNYNFYTTRVIRKANYYDAFSSSSLMSKINYNKALEETIGILYILPQLLLLEFYKLIKNYSGVKVPNKKLLKEKIINDEDKNLSYNNTLLISIYDFFKSCYEVYQTLIKEVNDMTLKYNAFTNVINCFQKARFNLSFISSSSENALINYNTDLKFIQKVTKERSTTLSVDLTEKMRNQFDFRKNAEKQRKIRIENALENRYSNDNDEKRRRYKSNKKDFISFMDSKLINSLMKHFTGKVRNEISTERINKEIDGKYDDDVYFKQKHQVVKIDI
jgi:hypothetical protein